MKESLKVLQECAELQTRKAQDYQNPNSFYYPNFNPNGVNWGDPDVMCDCCPPPPATWSCKLNTTTNGYECTDPGDGSGTYTSLVDCQVWCDLYILS